MHYFGDSCKYVTNCLPEVACFGVDCVWLTGNNSLGNTHTHVYIHISHTHVYIHITHTPTHTYILLELSYKKFPVFQIVKLISKSLLENVIKLKI